MKFTFKEKYSKNDIQIIVNHLNMIIEKYGRLSLNNKYYFDEIIEDAVSELKHPYDSDFIKLIKYVIKEIYGYIYIDEIIPASVLWVNVLKYLPKENIDKFNHYYYSELIKNKPDIRKSIKIFFTDVINYFNPYRLRKNKYEYTYIDMVNIYKMFDDICKQHICGYQSCTRRQVESYILKYFNNKIEKEILNILVIDILYRVYDLSYISPKIMYNHITYEKNFWR